MTARAGEAAPSGRAWGDTLLVALGLVVSVAALVWLTGNPLLAAVFAGGVVVFAGIVHGALALRPAPAAAEFAAPDWSVTHAAIEGLDDAVAITDRAGRLVCANGAFAQWFGTAAPPRLPLDAGDPARAEEAGRAAWRDGKAHGGEVTAAMGTYTLTVHRAGRGEDHLIWRLVPVIRHDPVSEAVAAITGKPGRAFGRESIQAAVVAPDGRILAANGAFALRATGTDSTDLTGSDFVGHFESDAAQDIFIVEIIRNLDFRHADHG